MVLAVGRALLPVDVNGRPFPRDGCLTEVVPLVVIQGLGCGCELHAPEHVHLRQSVFEPHLPVVHEFARDTHDPCCGLRSLEPNAHGEILH